MRKYKVRISGKAFKKIEDFSKFIISVNTKDSSEKYIDELINEILTLSYRADTIPILLWKTCYIQKPDTKRLLVKKGKVTVFFHTIEDFVMVDDIVPSKLLNKKVK